MKNALTELVCFFSFGSGLHVTKNHVHDYQ